MRILTHASDDPTNAAMMIYGRATNRIPSEPEIPYHIFLSHSHLDRDWVEELAERLEDEHDFRPWLDCWVLVPGQPWQRAMARGLQQSACCAVCLGAHTPRGWFEMEIDKALDRQAREDDFRVIPVLLPGVDAQVVKGLQEVFLGLNTWVDFREGSDLDRAFHLLTCGIRGIAPGRRRPPNPPARPGNLDEEHHEKLVELQRLHRAKLVDDSVVIDLQRRILDTHFDL